MDLVYILGTGTVWENNELRYSLRSVFENVKDLENVYVVGELPFWLTSAIHLTCDDRYPEKWRNGYHKIFRAVNEQSLSEEFLLMNDDFFINEPLEAKKFPYYHRGQLTLGRHRNKPPSWTTWQNTANRLSGRNKSLLNYAVHCPFRYEKKKFLEMPLDPMSPGSYSVRAFYGNYYGVGGQNRADQVLRPNMGLSGFKKFTTGKTDFGMMSACGREPDFRKFIAGRFPLKSPFEK